MPYHSTATLTYTQYQDNTENCQKDSSVSIHVNTWNILTLIIVMKQSRCKILVADSDKFKESYMYKVGEVSDFDYIITDNHVDKTILDKMSHKANVIAVDTIE